METLSVVLVTLNEERNIDRCLGSVRWADEIVVVDSFSTDRTVELARGSTRTRSTSTSIPARASRWSGGSGMPRATGFSSSMPTRRCPRSWRPRSGQMLRRGDGHGRVHVHPQAAAFGRWIEHGGWFPDYQFRFFRRDSYYPEHQEIHGGFNTEGNKGQLQGYLYPSHVRDDLRLRGEDERVHVAPRVEQAEGQPGHRRARWHNLILSPLSHFLRMFISQQGVQGWISRIRPGAARRDVCDAAVRQTLGIPDAAGGREGAAPAHYQCGTERPEAEGNDDLSPGPSLPQAVLAEAGASRCSARSCSRSSAVCLDLSDDPSAGDTVLQAGAPAAAAPVAAPAARFFRAGLSDSRMASAQAFQELVFRDNPADSLLNICIVVVVAFFFRNIFGYLQSNLMMAVEQGLIRDLRNALYRHIHALPLAYFTNERTGNLISRDHERRAGDQYRHLRDVPDDDPRTAAHRRLSHHHADASAGS